ncbi:Olfactomedin-like protein 1 [Collichthys lucidus]|uniref:Olfactomedin-like protein 1 n=1 Tax=Collichthys lucidus TaxID=240159 RepID=A0A4V6XYK2_COLLU|nr:Olfactomedin-like protein 1 [Collichthys lucidus]
MSGRLLPVLLLSLFLTVGSVQSQGSSQDAFIIQYLERRLSQMEERLNQCEQNTASLTQKTYDISSEIRSYLSATDIEIEEALLEQQIKAAELDQLKKKAKIKMEKDCSAALTQIKSLKIVKKVGDTSGSWFRDPSEGSAKVYLLSGIRNNTVLEFVSLQSFAERITTPPAKVLQLPFHWQGTGHVVYNGFLYCHKADTPNQIQKVDLLNGTVVDSTLIPGAGHVPVYGLNLNTYLDMAVDELGLWVIYADPEYGGNLVITKLDKGSLAVEYTWDTQCRSRDAEGAFLICGTLYVVYNVHYGGRSTIQCLYDIHDTIHSVESPVMFFPKRYTSHSSIHYHPGDKQLYAWDDGYQTIYKVETRVNDQTTAEYK